MIDNPIYSMLQSSSVFALIYYILYIIGIWNVFVKAGEPGWKALIPIYNFYIMYKIAWQTSMFWIMIILAAAAVVLSAMTVIPVLGIIFSIASIACSIAVLLCSIIVNIKLGHSFNKSTGFIVGLVLLSPIFIIILGLGSSTYSGAQN